MIANSQSVDSVGGENNADLIFQLAIDDSNSTKDWVKIVEAVGNQVTPESAQKWFENITNSQKRDRWTKEEENLLRSLIFPKQQLKCEEIYELFQNRSKKAVINKMSRLRNDERSKIENSEDQPRLQYEVPTNEPRKMSISNKLLNKINK